jgi:hypothetical protein
VNDAGRERSAVRDLDSQRSKSGLEQWLEGGEDAELYGLMSVASVSHTSATKFNRSGMESAGRV